MCPWIRSVASRLITLIVALASLSAEAGNGPPSAVRARQIYGGAPRKSVPARSVQDSGSAGPQLLAPPIEGPFETDDEPAYRSNRPEMTEPIEGDDSAPLDAPQDIAPPIDVTPRGPVAPGSVGPESVAPPAGAFPPPNVVPNGGAAGGECDFWIVSSRGLPQQAGGRALTAPLGFYRCNRGNEPVRSDAAVFQQSFAPGTPVCVVVHGSFTDWGTVCSDAGATHRWLRNAAPHLPLQVVFYSWPSEAATVVLPPLDTELLGMRAEFNGLYLTQLVQRIPPQSPVCLMGHSHGARAITSCLHLLGGGSVQGYRMPNPRAIPHRIRGVYLAAALDRHWIVPGEQYCAALPRAESILNVRNCSDWALAFYPMRTPFSGSAIGREGLDPVDRRRMGALAAKYRESDASPYLGTAHLWPAYLRRPEIASQLAPWAYFADAGGAGSGNAYPAPDPSAATDQTSPTFVPDQPAGDPNQPFTRGDRPPFAPNGTAPFNPPARGAPDPLPSQSLPPQRPLTPDRTYAPSRTIPESGPSSDRMVPPADVLSPLDEPPPRSTPSLDSPRTYAPDSDAASPPRTFAPTNDGAGRRVPYGTNAGQPVPYYRIGPTAYPAAPPSSWSARPQYAPAPTGSNGAYRPQSAVPGGTDAPPHSPATPPYSSPGQWSPFSGRYNPSPGVPNANPASTPPGRFPASAPRVPAAPGTPFPSGSYPSGSFPSDSSPSSALPGEDGTHPVHIESKPFVRPQKSPPSIFRRYYPEADNEMFAPGQQAARPERVHRLEPDP